MFSVQLVSNYSKSYEQNAVKFYGKVQGGKRKD